MVSGKWTAREDRKVQVAAGVFYGKCKLRYPLINCGKRA